MNLIDVMTNPWAIVPDKLRQIQLVVDRHLSGEHLNSDQISAALGQSQAKQKTVNAVTDYQRDGAVAIIGLDGVLAKRMNMMTQISGGTSMEIAGLQIKHATVDESVKGIILAIDSPGGTVDGVQTLAGIIHAAAKIKPVVAFADGMMASAAYWAGAAAGSIYLASSTTMAGSIGVVSQHIDRSARDQMAGLKVTEIYAGKFKRIAGENAPLSDDGRSYMQDMVDQLYSIFVGEVAKFRGVSVDAALAMADGRTFIGDEAVRAGLVDGMASLDDLIRLMQKSD